MKKVIFTLCVIVPVYLLAFGQAAEHSKKTGSVSEGTLRVELNKSEYILLEPIVAKFSLRLPSAEAIGDLSRSTSIRLIFGDRTTEFNGLRHYITIKDPIPLPSGIPHPLPLNDAARPNGDREYVKEEIIDRVDEFFPVPGSYQIQFFVHTSAGTTVASNIISLTVREPSGTNKAAYDILRSNERPMSFYWVWEDKEGLRRLQDFANEYKNTLYGEYAIFHLASVYLAKGEFDKAENEFKKIRSSNNSHLAKAADLALEDIRKHKIHRK